ncbi:MAG: glucose-6-phosphate isomerase [Pseudomonadota bacterium]
MNIIKKTALSVALIGPLALAGCTAAEQNTAIATAGGGALGAVTAAALGANAGWIAVAGVAGATAGALYARNSQTGQCAYARGDGTYIVRACPR